MADKAEGDLRSQLQDYGLKSGTQALDRIQSKVCTIRFIIFYFLSPLSSGAFRQKLIFGHFGDFQSAWIMGHISSDPIKNVFAAYQHAFLSTSIAFCNIFAWARAETEIWKKESYVGFLKFFICLSFFLLLLSISCSD